MKEVDDAIASVKDDGLKFILKEFWEQHVPAYFFEEPASSSGKFHPYYANGRGGLLRHTLSALEEAERIIRVPKEDRLSAERCDEVRIAVLLHDILKYGDVNEYEIGKRAGRKMHTHADHGFFAAACFNNFAASRGLDSKRARIISVALSGHMGVFAPRHLDFEVASHDEQDVLYIVTRADFLVSQKDHKSVMAERLFKEHQGEAPYGY
ncbi:MAG: hypothetical protein WCL16_05580 [bacterium]